MGESSHAWRHCGLPNTGFTAGFTRMSPSTRSGRSADTLIEIAPPIELPTTTPGPYSSSVATTRAALRWIVALVPTERV